VVQIHFGAPIKSKAYVIIKPFFIVKKHSRRTGGALSNKHPQQLPIIQA
jgi:hypothetical protein